MDIYSTTKLQIILYKLRMKVFMFQMKTKQATFVKYKIRLDVSAIKSENERV